jgi:hypothetical protein
MTFKSKAQMEAEAAGETYTRPETPKPTTAAEMLLAAKENIWIPGRVLPDGAEKINAPIGEPEHRCIDLQRRYQPSWKAIYINKDQETPPSLPINGPNDQIYTVPTGEWVDVPPFVLSVLRGCVYTITDTKDRGLIAGGVQYTKTTRPRFSIHVMDSA